MGLVSTLPWAITVRLPRFSGGIGWLLALTISTSVLVARGTAGQPVRDSDVGDCGVVGLGLPRVPSRVWSATSWVAIEGLIAAPALVLAWRSMAAACRWVSRANVPLEAAQ